MKELRCKCMNNIWNKYSEVQSAILYEYVLQTFETL